MFNWNVIDTAINYLYKKPVKMLNGEISHPFASYIEDFIDKNEFYERLHDLENDISCYDTEQILLMIDRNYILEFLEDIRTHLTIEEYSKIIMNEYSDANTGQYNMDYIIRLFADTDVFLHDERKRKRNIQCSARMRNGLSRIRRV
ncbi:hypothetical protein [Hominisplanchenecus murintestinalis]|uniref:hypothetical protein n=1 Tax=Hominisplanchenecus murintestinalis TaxID=2941517 RepID=UPI0020406D50|nr:hypothetical protein [Hominisplanchenecus murintestinalis]